MDFGHDTEHAIVMAADLASSLDPVSGEEELGDLDALDAFARQHEITGAGAGGTEDLVAVHRLRERLRQVFTAGSVEDAVAQVNRLIADVGALPQLVDHDGEPWHLHYTPPHAPLAHRLGADAAMGLAVVLRDHGLDRFRSCEAPDCGDVFVDTSRNRSRRYCDSRSCGNRVHAAAYRARRRARDGGGGPDQTPA